MDGDQSYISNMYREQLVNLRSELIGALHTHPSSVYSDKTIEDLIAAKPKTLDELTKVKGFPKNGKRVNCFGKAVCAIFNPSTEKPVTVAPSVETLSAFK